MVGLTHYSFVNSSTTPRRSGSKIPPTRRRRARPPTEARHATRARGVHDTSTTRPRCVPHRHHRGRPARDVAPPRGRRRGGVRTRPVAGQPLARLARRLPDSQPAADCADAAQEHSQLGQRPRQLRHAREALGPRLERQQGGAVRAGAKPETPLPRSQRPRCHGLAPKLQNMCGPAPMTLKESGAERRARSAPRRKF